MLMINRYRIQDPGKRGQFTITVPAPFKTSHGVEIGQTLYCYVKANSQQPKNPVLTFTTAKDKDAGLFAGEYNIARQGGRKVGMRLKVPAQFITIAGLSAADTLCAHISVDGLHYTKDPIPMEGTQ